MSSQLVRLPSVVRRSWAIPRLGLFLALLVAGCTTGGPSAIKPLPDLTGAPTATATPAVTAAPPIATPAPTEVPGPPAAALTPIGKDAIPGELGSFSWHGAGSDAPWLVPPAGQAVSEAGPYAVTFAAPVLVEGWAARWAPVADGTAGAVAGFEQGGTGPVVLEGPDQPGTWSLQVDARFAGGNRCAYYWRLEVAP